MSYLTNRLIAGAYTEDIRDNEIKGETSEQCSDFIQKQRRNSGPGKSRSWQRKVVAWLRRVKLNRVVFDGIFTATKVLFAPLRGKRSIPCRFRG